MTRFAFVLLFVAILLGQARATAQAPAVSAAATPESAATFLGDWTVDANGSYGPATFAIALKTAAGRVVGEITSAALPKQAIEDVSKEGSSLILRYTFDYQGNPLNAVIRLTPADGKVMADLDFADGAAQMAGTATKKTN